MRLLMAISLILTASVEVAAQIPNDAAAGIKILRVSLQAVKAKGPSMRAVPSTDPASRARENAERQRSVDNNPALHRLSKDAEIAPLTNQNSFGDIPSGTPVIFVASIVVKNTGNKAITAVHWEYLLFNPGEKEPVKTYSVKSKNLIAPNEQAELRKEVSPKGKEHQARITRVEYADRSVWESK